MLSEVESNKHGPRPTQGIVSKQQVKEEIVRKVGQRRFQQTFQTG